MLWAMSFFWKMLYDKVNRLSTNRTILYVKYQCHNSHCSKVVSKVKVSDRFTEWQNDRQEKNICPPFSISGGIKINWFIETGNVLCLTYGRASGSLFKTYLSNWLIRSSCRIVRLLCLFVNCSFVIKSIWQSDLDNIIPYR